MKHKRKILDRLYLWALRKTEVARFEKIAICSPRNGSDIFGKIISTSLQLIRDTDPRRFKRVKKYIKRIVNCTLDKECAIYRHDLGVCSIDFEFSNLKPDSESNVIFFARTLIHEATHGVVYNQNIPYTQELRTRIEKLCVTEENRFVRRLTPADEERAKARHREFDASEWKATWNRTRTESHLRAFLRLFFR